MAGVRRRHWKAPRLLIEFRFLPLKAPITNTFQGPAPGSYTTKFSDSPQNKTSPMDCKLELARWNWNDNEPDGIEIKTSPADWKVPRLWGIGTGTDPRG
ncbi:MAG: hypothetical protein ACI87O_000803 [Planctomycetota bacterium]|jgi:hypothetical protein